MAMTDKSCREFVDLLAAKVSVPGGGGAAAMVGAVGTALSNMVGNFTVGKKKYADVEEEVQKLIDEGGQVIQGLLDLVEQDAAAFEPLSRAYGLPNGTDEEKKIKAETMERESIAACQVPMDIIRLSYQGIKIHQRMGEIGSRMLISDVGCGVMFLKAALIAGQMNVAINLNSIQDENFIKQTRAEMMALVSEGSLLAEDVSAKVLAEIVK